MATGNTDRQALDLNSKAQFRTERREDRYRLLGDFGRENGVVTAERIEAGLHYWFLRLLKICGGA